MCLNSRGENDNGQNFFQKNFRRGKMTEGITVYNISLLLIYKFLYISKIFKYI